MRMVRKKEVKSRKLNVEGGEKKLRADSAKSKAETKGEERVNAPRGSG